ncbi:MAG: hypothetical protein R6U96_08695, partial [Promethearchaeia archaeon]
MHSEKIWTYRHIIDKSSEGSLLKMFIDTYEALIFKLGKHILYNNFLVVGSKFLNNSEKVSFNKARAFYYEKKFKKSVESYHDIIEKTIREFLYNLLYLKYEENWEDFLPVKVKNYINHIRKKEQKKFGNLLNKSGNSLYYLSRGYYSLIVDDDYLWDNVFSNLFGTNYRSFIKEHLDNIADLGHLDKHNRKDDDLKEISTLIQQNVKISKEVVEKINRAYFKVIQQKTLILKKLNIMFRTGPNEKKDKLRPISINKDKNERILDFLNSLEREDPILFEKFISLSNRNFISETFGLSYRDFMA